jgi:hypothetical protein
MAWDIEFTDEFGAWWDGLTEAEQDSVAADGHVLGEFGPALGRPHVRYGERLTVPQHEGIARSVRWQAVPDTVRLRSASDSAAADWREQNGQRAMVQRIRSSGGPALREALAALKREKQHDEE